MINQPKSIGEVLPFKRLAMSGSPESGKAEITAGNGDSYWVAKR